MRKICFFTGSRSEFWLLRPVMEAVSVHPELDFRLIVSGAHLSAEHGMTVHEIEQAGFAVSERVEMLLSSDTSVATCKSMGIGMLGISEALNRIRPDILVVLGDRYETFAAVTCACIMQIPVAHLHGGEITTGAYDDSLRHAITKMSSLHFVSTEEYGKRVIQLGEQPDTVVCCGSVGVESIRKMKLLRREQLEDELGFNLGDKCAVVTFHPVTREPDGAVSQVKDLLEVLVELGDLHLLITGANADARGLEINAFLMSVAETLPERIRFFSSLGQLRYFSALQFVDFVVGNSSSGIIEAPSFGIPVINIGDRQKGRVQAQNIINCAPLKKQMKLACELALSSRMKEQAAIVNNPYEKANTVECIVSTLAGHGIINRKKDFFDLNLDQIDIGAGKCVK